MRIGAAITSLFTAFILISRIKIHIRTFIPHFITEHFDSYKFTKVLQNLRFNEAIAKSEIEAPPPKPII